MERRQPPLWAILLLMLGGYLTLRGYHSFDGDQAYRLPLLLHRQEPSLYRHDPFVRTFDVFNPHVGSLAILDLASRPFGLSLALFGLFAVTFFATGLGIDRLARACWPGLGPLVGPVGFGLVLAAKAGNIGTNHLFESMLLDRSMALALGWLALSLYVVSPRRSTRSAPPLLGLAAWIHPSMGLQLAMLLAAGWSIATVAKAVGDLRFRDLIGGLGLLALAFVPAGWLQYGQSGALLAGMDPSDFYTLAALVQGPQHMIPHLWRGPQWLAAGTYLGLAALTLAGMRRRDVSHNLHININGDSARVRLATLLGLILLGLLASWVAIEWAHDLRATLFQPFRMATVARGLALVLIAGRVARLATDPAQDGPIRAGLIAAGVAGDLAFVAAGLVETCYAAGLHLGGRRAARAVGLAVFACSIVYLLRHDTGSGHLPMLAGCVAGLAIQIWATSRLAHPIRFDRARLSRLTLAAWILPALAIGSSSVWNGTPPGPLAGLTERLRFAEVPTDDLERLAVWCRTHTPESARFIGPPGPKTFRLWSRRSLAFNRAGSPYHASGLADWSRRFADHVGLDPDPKLLAAAYLKDRQALEHRYDAMTPRELAALARRQGASHVLASADLPEGRPSDDWTLERLQVEGRWAVYRIGPVVDGEDMGQTP